MEEKRKSKMVKVRINLPTLKPEFTINNMPDQKMLSQMVVMQNVLAVGTELEVSEDIANHWCGEVFYVPDGRFGVRNHQDVGVADSPYQMLQDSDVKYSDKIKALNEYAIQMDKATKIAIHRATIIR
jgi:hypothetical protein